VNLILPPADLRPYLIKAVERGIAREEENKKRALQVAGPAMKTALVVAAS